MAFQPTNTKNTAPEWLGWLPLAIGALVSAALLWAQFRSLDLLDAATHFLTYQFPEDNPDTHTRYHLIARPVWLLCGGNIVAFRLVCLGLISGAALLFWRGWGGPRTSPAQHRWGSLACWLSALAGLAWLPVVLGYNSLSTFFALIGLTALAPVLGMNASIPPSLAHRAFAAGVFVCTVVATALVKPPAALGLVAWGGFLVLWLLPMNRKLRLGLVLLAAGTLATGIWLVTRWISAPGTDPTQLINVGGVRFSAAWIASTLKRYGQELATFLPALGIDVLYICVPALGLAGLLAAKLRGKTLPAAINPLVLGTLAVSWITVVITRNLWDGSFTRAVSGEMARLYLLLWMALLPAWLVLLAHGGRLPRNTPLVIAMFFLPLTCGFGSTNTIYFSALHWTVFWTAGLWQLSVTLADLLAEPRLHRLVIGFLVLTAALHLFTGHFLRPYMHQPALWRQTESVTVGHPATVLRLDPATAGFLREIKTPLESHGFKPGDDMLGFFNLPGVIFALGARQPGAPWYFGTWYHGDDTDGVKLRQVSPERRQRAWIITQSDVSHFQKQFREAGIDFPDGYVKIGMTLNPANGLEIGIWKPKPRP